jgi:hypothetical protein
VKQKYWLFLSVTLFHHRQTDAKTWNYPLLFMYGQIYYISSRFYGKDSLYIKYNHVDSSPKRVFTTISPRYFYNNPPKINGRNIILWGGNQGWKMLTSWKEKHYSIGIFQSNKIIFIIILSY